LDLHIYGIHLLNPYKTVVSHLNTRNCKECNGVGVKTKRSKEKYE